MSKSNIIQRMGSAYINLLICIGYGALSFLQTVNAKYLYHTAGFTYYSLSFATQRILSVLFMIILGYGHFNWKNIKLVAPFAFFMCCINLLSSFCLTVMPLGAFAAFKKTTIIFVLIVGIIMKAPKNFSTYQYLFMASIGIGALMVGAPDFQNGEFIGYLACVGYNLSEAFALQYSNYLSREKGFSPIKLLFYNSLISFPYYTSAILYQDQIPGIIEFFTNAPTLFYFSFGLTLFLGCFTQLVANYVTMKISPFQKATVSNVKDIFIMFVSVYAFNDFHLLPIAFMGSFFVFAGSVLFSVPYFRAFKGQNCGHIRLQTKEQAQQPICSSNDLNDNSEIQLQFQKPEIDNSKAKTSDQDNPQPEQQQTQQLQSQDKQQIVQITVQS